METHGGKFPRKDIDKKENKAYKDSWYNAKYLQIARSYPKYKELLEEVHAIDYNQMQIKALELLEKDNDVQYTNVLIDEFQDTDPIQMKIFERLMDNIKTKSKPTSFTVVGDLNQRIYGFRGSTKDYFKYLRDNYADDFEFKSLSTNYRLPIRLLTFQKISSSIKGMKNLLFKNLNMVEKLKIKFIIC